MKIIRAIVVIMLLVSAAAYAQSQNNPGTKQTQFKVESNSIRITPLGEHKARITGRVKVCKYETWEPYEDKEVYYVWEWWPYRKHSLDSYRRFHRESPPKTEWWGRKVRKFRAVTKTGKHQTHSYIPKHIKISHPYFDEEVAAEVMSDGQFSGIAELNKEHYFARGKSSKLKNGYSWWWQNTYIRFKAEHPKEQAKYYGPSWKHKCKFWFIDASSKVVKSLADCVSHVEIKIYEKNTRFPIESVITITPLEVKSFKKIQANWKARYDDYVAKKAKEEYDKIVKTRGVRDVLVKGGQSLRREASSVEFWAYRGGKYKIETRHKKYYYYSSVLEIDNAAKTDQTILLVEVGGKTRTDEAGDSKSKESVQKRSIPGISFSDTIDVLIKGVDDSVKTNKQQDYKEAVMNAKLQAIERAGVEIESITKVVNFQMKFDVVEAKAKAVLLPGFQIMDVGYQTDGTYQVVLSGKVRVGKGEPKTGPKSLMNMGKREEVHGDKYFKKGEYKKADGSYSKAIKHFKIILKSFPGSDEALMVDREAIIEKLESKIGAWEVLFLEERLKIEQKALQRLQSERQKLEEKCFRDADENCNWDGWKGWGSCTGLKGERRISCANARWRCNAAYQECYKFRKRFKKEDFDMLKRKIKKINSQLSKYSNAK